MGTRHDIISTGARHFVGAALVRNLDHHLTLAILLKVSNDCLLVDDVLELLVSIKFRGGTLAAQD